MDWPLEQYVRDAKIDTLYEGTTAIQGLDFFFRKIVKDQGLAIGKISSEMSAFAASGGSLAEQKQAFGKALQEVGTMISTLVGHAMASQENVTELYKIGLNTSRLLMAVGDVVIAWLLLRQAEIAMGRLDGKDKEFYAGKVAAAKYFVSHVLPHITADRKILEAEDGSLMNLAESSF